MRHTIAPSSPASAAEEPASYIGRYRVIGWLGSGGMGEVLAGHDEKLDRPVAIKRLRADLVVTEERRRRLAVEAQLNARLSHPNVVQVYDFVSSDGLDHIVSEYVDGQALSELVLARRPSIESAIEFLAAVACGLEAAHRRGIVHRDLKLENILVSRDGQAGGPIAVGPPIDGATAAARRAAPGVVHVTPTVHRALARSYRLTPAAAEVTNGHRSPVLYRLGDPLARTASLDNREVGR